MIKFAIWVYIKHNFIKKFVKISVALFALLVSLQVAAIIFIQFPKIQTWLVQKCVAKVSDNINGDITVGNVYYLFFNKLIIKDIAIVSKDNTPLLDSLRANCGYSDTLLACNKLSVNLDVTDLFKGKFKLNKIVVDGGEFNLQTEVNRKSNLDRIFNIQKKEEKDTSASLPSLLANTVKVKNFRFTMKNHIRYRFKGDHIINFADLDVRDINVNISDVHLKSDTLYALINNIQGTDKSGMALVNLQGKARVSGTEVLVSDFYLQDNFSTINSRYFYMKYDSPKDLSDFTQKVKLGLDMNGSYLNFKSIGKIAPSLAESSLAFHINGAISGPVRDLSTKGLVVTSETGHSFLEIDARITGLPSVASTMAVATIYNSSTTFNDIANIVASINSTRKNKVLASLAPRTGFSYKGTLTGMLTDFVIDGKVKSPVGSADVDLLFRVEEKRGTRFNGFIDVDNVNLGHILNKGILGETSASATLDVLFKRRGGIDLTVDSLNIDNFFFYGYNYSQIQGKGVFEDGIFTGEILSNDPNFKFAYNGMASLKGSPLNGSEYDFSAELAYANLAALNFDMSSNVSEMSFKSDVELLANNENSITGNLRLEDFQFKSDKGQYKANNIDLKLLNSSNVHTATLDAPFARMEYSGPVPADLFVKKFIDLAVLSKADNMFDRDTSITYRSGIYNFSLKTLKTRTLLDIAVPGLYIEDGTSLKVFIDRDDNLTCSLLSGRLAMGSHYLKGINLALGTSADTTDARLFSDEVHIAGMTIDSTSIDLCASNNVLDAGFVFRNDSTENNSANIHTNVRFGEGKNILLNILSGSNISLEGEKWNFTPAQIAYNDSTIVVNDFNIVNSNQKFSLNGNVSKYSADTLNFGLDNFNVGIFNLFLRRAFDVQGNFSGNGVVSDLYRAPKVFFNIEGSDVYVYRNKVGNLKMMSRWNDWDKELNLFIKSNLDDKITLNANGFYRPEDSYLNLNASLEDLSVGYFEPFLSDIISRSSGSMSGELKLSGPLNRLSLTGEDCRFNNLNFKLNFTQVPYTVNGPFELNERGIFFTDLAVTDRFGSKGKMSGKFGYNYFRDLHLDTKVTFTNFQCLDTRETDNEYFYGQAFATGSVHLKGPLEKINIDIDVVSNKNTSIHIPLQNSATASQTNLLTFVEPFKDRKVDVYDSLQTIKANLVKKSTELSVDVDARVTPDAEVMIEIDKSVGDVIKARGNGVIGLSINPSRDIFDLYGDYHVTDGSYKFVLAGIASRDFLLQPGGTINFNGDITNTTLDLDAVYTTKSSINALISDTSSVATRRTVNCIIGMNGKMMNPELNFKIEIPDLDPTTKIRVESAFNTQGKIQKQFMGLLVTGNFLPDDQSGIANNSSMWYSNASEMLSNQISNIFHQLGIPVDLGLEYQPGEKGTTDIFDVAVSTQLFNNRVVINGNIGNDPYAHSDRSVIGNLDVQIKLDNSGNVRLDLFSHAEDKYSAYNDAENSQRSGVGIVYQKEFNTFKDLFRGKSKAQKAYEKQERAKRKAAKKLLQE